MQIILGNFANNVGYSDQEFINNKTMKRGV